MLVLNKTSVTFPSVKLGQWKDTTVTVTNTGTDTLKVTNISSTNSVFAPRPTTKNLAPNQSFTDTIRYSPTAIGIASGRIIITSNDVTTSDTVIVSGFGVGVPVLTLNKTSIIFPSVKLSQWKDTTVVVTNTGTDTLKVTNISSTNSVFSPRPTTKNLPPGQSFTDTIRYSPTAIGTINGKIVITSNDVTTTDTVVVSGFGVGVPVLVLNKTSVTFPSVKLGQWKDTTVTVSNTGTDTLKVTNISSTNSVFAPRPTAKNLAPGQSFTDTIRYSPTAIGTASGKITITSNDVTTSDTVVVSGFESRYRC